MCVSEHITRIAAGLDCFYSGVLVCRSHSERGNEAEIKRKMPTGPEDKKRPWQRQRGRERERLDVAFPVGVHPLFPLSRFLSSLLSLPHTHCPVPPPTPAPSWLLSADCLGASWCLSGPSLYVSIKHSIYLIIALTTAY